MCAGWGVIRADEYHCSEGVKEGSIEGVKGSIEGVKEGSIEGVNECVCVTIISKRQSFCLILVLNKVHQSCLDLKNQIHVMCV